MTGPRAVHRGGRGLPEWDSLIDLLFNVLGALFFVVVYAALSSSGARGKVTLPMVSPADTKAVLFECRNNTILFPDIEGLRADASNAVARAGPAGYAESRNLRGLNISNSFYVCVNQGHFVPVAGSRGETAFEAQREDSVFRARLARFDPTNHHIFFIVRTDSFEVFHSGRTVALERGFRIGWEPYDKERDLIFGSGGGRQVDNIDL